MHIVGTIFYALILLAAGAVSGAVALTVWWGRWMRNADNCRGFLQRMYRRSHPHWLKRQSDPPGGPRICPCCGWSETKGIGVSPKTGTVDDPHAPSGTIN